VPTPALNSAILLTPPAAAGGSAIAVVRLRGPSVAQFLARCFSKTPLPNRCVHGELRDGDSIIDDPVVVLAADGLWADVSLHGGAWVVESALALARREGFEILPGGTLPLPDAALDDDSSLFEREMLAHLPLARTEPAIRMLLDQPNAWHRAIDADLDARSILAERTLWRLLNLPKVAIVGEPNVGKSTLANQLFGQQRSITADLPGTTRDWVGEIADIDGLAVLLVDTPGQRDAADAIERAAIAASQEQIQASDLILVVLDATVPPASAIAHPQPLVVVNKTDQPSGWDFQSLDAIPISARTGQGLGDLRREIHRRLGIEGLNDSRPRWWTQRQKAILAESIAGSAPLDPRLLTGNDDSIAEDRPEDRPAQFRK
jgi:small GTP-binding protein